MKISWGTGIIIVFSLFITALIVIIVFSFSRESELVTDNYYEKEIFYQDQIEKVNRTNQLDEKPELIQGLGNLQVKFPRSFETVAGKIYFYRPSDAKSDFAADIMADTSGIQVIDLNSLKPGYWKVSLQWTMKGEQYFLEKAIIL